MFINNVNAYNFFSKEDLLEWSITNSKQENPCYIFGKIMGIKVEQDYNSNMEYFNLSIKSENSIYNLVSMGVSNYYYSTNKSNNIDYGLYINNNIFDVNLGDLILVKINKGGNYIIHLENFNEESLLSNFESKIVSQDISKCEKLDINQGIIEKNSIIKVFDENQLYLVLFCILLSAIFFYFIYKKIKNKK